jgi:hypothetical protein
MTGTFPNRTHTDHVLGSGSLARAIVMGAIGGVLATIGMDLFGAALFLLLGGPASLSFSVIGDAAAQFASLLGIQVAGGMPLGALLHYLIGILQGVIVSVAASRIGALHMDSVKRSVGLTIAYIELTSLPLLAAAAILLTMTASQTAQWFGISFVMHLIFGLALGLFVTYIGHPGVDSR